MRVAFSNGIIGSIISFFLGISYLGLSPLEVLQCLGAANFASLISVLVTLTAERAKWIPNTRYFRTTKTWSLLVILYCSILIGLAPPLRETRNLTILFLPLLLSTGFAILVFGPIQDSIVRRQQRKELQKTNLFST